jgi:hypothetical protein
MKITKDEKRMVNEAIALVVLRRNIGGIRDQLLHDYTIFREIAMKHSSTIEIGMEFFMLTNRESNQYLLTKYPIKLCVDLLDPSVEKLLKDSLDG